MDRADTKRSKVVLPLHEMNKRLLEQWNALKKPTHR